MNAPEKDPHRLVKERFIKWAFVLVFIWFVWPIAARASLWLQNELWPMAARGADAGWAEIGQSGDMFGSLNTLFAGLGFVALVLTLRLQMDEAKETRKEVQLNIRTAIDQQFEASFFQLLNAFNNQIDGLRGSYGIPKEGREFIRVEAYRLSEELTRWTCEDPEVTKYRENASVEEVEEVANDRYMTFYNQRDYYLASYFRVMYRILRWIERSDQKDKWFYVKILRAQLSPQEVFILMFNCVGDYGEEMKKLVEKYALLKHVALDKDLVVFKRLFKDSAFIDPEDRGSSDTDSDASGIVSGDSKGGGTDLAPAMTPAEKVVQLRETEKSISDVIKFADQKAAIFITLNLGLLVLALNKDWLVLSDWLQFSSWILWLVGVVMLFCVVFPWGYIFSKREAGYYDAVAIKHLGASGYISMMMANVPYRILIGDIADVVHHRAVTSNRKYRFLTFGLGLSVLGLAGLVAALISGRK